MFVFVSENSTNDHKYGQFSNANIHSLLDVRLRNYSEGLE